MMLYITNSLVQVPSLLQFPLSAFCPRTPKWRPLPHSCRLDVFIGVPRNVAGALFGKTVWEATPSLENGSTQRSNRSRIFLNRRGRSMCGETIAVPRGTSGCMLNVHKKCAHAVDFKTFVLDTQPDTPNNPGPCRPPWSLTQLPKGEQSGRQRQQPTERTAGPCPDE